MTGRNIDSEAFTCTKGDVLADFKLERPKNCNVIALQQAKSWDKNQNYPVVDNRSINFTIIMSIVDKNVKIPQNGFKSYQIKKNVHKQESEVNFRQFSMRPS